MRQALDRARLVAKLPVAVVDRGDGAGTHDALQLEALVTGDFRNRTFQRQLHFRQSRDRHPDRQVVVQNVILTHIGVCQHIIAKALAVAQAGAMANHQPGMRAQHGDMVGDRLGVGRADADIDQRNAGMALFLQVIGWHLRQAAKHRIRIRPVATGGGDDVARLHEGRVAFATILHQLPRPCGEFVDIELVVGEQHEVLEMAGARCRIMAEAGQRIIDALRGERRKRRGFAGHLIIFAIGNEIVGVVEIRRVEKIAQRHVGQRGCRRRLDISAFAKGEMQRNGRGRFGNRHRNAVVLDQKPQLLFQVVAEKLRPGDRRRVDAGGGDMAVGKARIDMTESGCLEADLRITGAVAAGNRRTLGKFGEGVDEERRIAFVKRGQSLNSFFRLRERLRRERLGADEGEGRNRSFCYCHGPL